MPDQETTTQSSDDSGLLSLDGLHSRRAFLKKAGLGSAAVAAVWAMPQITSVGAQKAYAASTGLCIPTTIDFEQFNAGDVITDINGIQVAAIGGHANRAMIFDTENYTGGDSDLSWPGPGSNPPVQQATYGNVLIVQENVGTVPDDAIGGCLTFKFPANPVNISYVTLLDIEETNKDTTIEVFSDLTCTTLIKSEVVATTSNGGVTVTNMSASDVRCMKVTFAGSGAVAEFVCPCP